MPGLVSHLEDLGFYREGGEVPGGLWAEGQDLTQVLTGALWWLLQRDQTVGVRAGARVPERMLFRGEKCVEPRLI